MRCHKCGFISFDHLSECKNCTADLGGLRNALGFLDFKPSVPFVLGALLKSQQSAGASLFGAGTPIQGGGFSGDVRANGTSDTLMDLEGLDDELTIELSDDEVNNMIDGPEMAGESAKTAQKSRTTDDFGAEIQIGDDLEIDFSEEGPQPGAGGRAVGSMSTAKTAGVATETMDDDLVLELKDDDLETLLLELDDEPAAQN